LYSEEVTHNHYFLAEHLQSLVDYHIRLKSASRLDSEEKLIITFVHSDGVLQLTLFRLLRKLHTLVAKVVFAILLDVDVFCHYIVAEMLARAGSHQLQLLLLSEHCQLFLVQLNRGFRTHDTCGHWGPFGVYTGDSLFSNEAEVQDLVATELHNEDGVFPVAVDVVVLDRHHASVSVLLVRSQLDVVRGHAAVLLISRALFVEAVLHGALVAEGGALADILITEFIDVVRAKGNKPEAVSDELIIERGGVLSHLDHLNSHGRHFRDYGASQGVGHS